MVVLSALKPAPDEELEIAHNLGLGQADAVSCATSSISSGLQHLRAQRDALNRIGTCYGGVVEEGRRTGEGMQTCCQ